MNQLRAWHRSAAERCVDQILANLGYAVNASQREMMVREVIRAISVANGDS